MVRYVLQFGAMTGAVLIVAMMVIVFTEVVSRGLFGFSFLVADEYSGYLVVALTFLGIPYALEKEALLRVEVIFGSLRERPQTILALLFDVISLICTSIIGFYVLRLTLTSFERGTFSSTPAMTPIWIPQAIMPLGMALVAIVLLVRIRGRISALATPSPSEGRQNR